MNQKFEKNIENTSLSAIDYLYQYMERGTKIEIWIKNNKDKKIQGIIRGFDEWMNLVLDQSIEINSKKNTQN